MFLWLLLLFAVLPAVEIALLIQVFKGFGVLPTLALVLLTATVGAALARHEGLRTMRRMQEQLARGQMPAEELIDGFLILFAGAVLLTPGFVTDLWGLLILFPPTRAFFKRTVKQRLERQVLIYQSDFEPAMRGRPSAPFEIIDVTDLDDDEEEEDDRTLH